MRITIDIPDAIYRGLESKASLEGTTVTSIVLKLVLRELDGGKQGVRTEFPLIRGKESRKLHLTNAEIEEVLLG